MQKFDIYSVTKFLSEIKHRRLKHLNIIDLIIFGYIQSTDIISENSLLGSIFLKTKTGEEFITSGDDLVRDYINSNLFYHAVECIINAGSMNRALDLYSKEPISKFEILNIFSQKFDLKVRIDETLNLSDFNITGFKRNYYPTSRALGKFGYEPDLSSKDALMDEAKRLSFTKISKFGLSSNQKTNIVND